MNVVKLEKVKKVTAKDYLTVPFYECVDNEKFYSTTQVMKIFTAGTGVGKTYSTATEFIPYLFNEHKVKLIVVSAPQNEILDISDFYLGSNLNNYQVVETIDKALLLAKMGMNVVLLTNHQSIMTDDKGKKLFNYLMTTSDKFAIFVDEAHTFLCSGKENYKDNLGHYSSTYEAKFFKTISHLSVKSPYIFGLTATPNSEQLGLLPTVDGMKFQVMNEMAPKDLLITKVAYLNTVKYYDTLTNFNVEIAYEDFLVNAYSESYACGIKKTAIVSCGIETAANGFTKTYVLELTKKILKDEGLTETDVGSIALLTGKKSETGIYSVDGSFEKCSGQEIKEKLNDYNDSLMIVLVVQKGQMGFNGYTYKNYFSFKSSDKKNKSGESLTEFAIQGLGRLTRLNSGLSTSDFTKDYGYDLGNYIKTLNDDQIEKLLIANSMNIVVPDNAMWGETIKTFSEKYVSSLLQAKTYFDNLKK